MVIRKKDVKNFKKSNTWVTFDPKSGLSFVTIVLFLKEGYLL